MPKINQEEYEVLKGLDDKWKWIARDKDEEPYNIQELIDEYLDDEYGYFNMKLSREFEEFIKKESEETEVKDSEWLKEEIWYSDRNIGLDWKEFVLNLITQLDEPEVLSQEWIDNHTDYAGNCCFSGVEDEPVVTVNNLQNLIVPKQEVTFEQAYNKIAETFPATAKEIVSVLDKYYSGMFIEFSEELHESTRRAFDVETTSKTIEALTGMTLEQIAEEARNGGIVPKQEITEEQAWEKISQYYPVKQTGLENAFEHFYYGGFMTDVVAKKPVIPQWVADNIEFKKRIGTRLNVAMSGFPETKLQKELDIDEYECNEIYARAWLDGYTVEEEQKYYVLDSEDIPLLEIANNQTCKTTTGLSIYEDGRDNSRFELTEQEVKDYDTRFWPFAVKVEELEE